MDFLLSIRKEFHIGFRKGYTDTTGKLWGYGLFLGWITLVVTNVRLLMATMESREDYKVITYEKLEVD